MMSARKQAIRFVTMVCATLLLAACFVPTGSGTALEISIEATVYGYEATFDFGNVDLEAGAMTVTANVTNVLGSAITVNAVSTAPPFAEETPATPFSIASGETAEVSLSFDPDVMGAASDTLDIDLEGLTEPFVLNLTGTGVAPGSDVLSVVIDAASYGSDASPYDFGYVDPDAGAAVVSMSLVNMIDGTVTVTSVSAGAQGISLTFPDDVPFDIAADSAVAGTLTFDPVDTGVAAAQFDISLASGSDLFTFNVAGEGNFPPVAEVIVEVSGANPDINGTYELTSETSPDGYRVYRLPESVYTLFGQDDEGIAWYIDQDLDTAGGYLLRRPMGITGGLGAPSVLEAEWEFGTGVEVRPNVVGEIDTTSVWLYAGNTVSAHYRYVDEEGDSPGTAQYQWYRSDTIDQTGSYTAIDDVPPGSSSSQSYTTTSGDIGYHLKVRVTPVATSGTSPGQPVELGPSRRVEPPPS